MLLEFTLKEKDNLENVKKSNSPSWKPNSGSTCPPIAYEYRIELNLTPHIQQVS